MGRYRRAQPKKLKTKLKKIRTDLGLTQDELVRALKKHARGQFLDSGYISRFESGKGEPSLLVLLAYSKLSGLSVNDLIDDRIRLSHR